jgi:hypothetical protein
MDTPTTQPSQPMFIFRRGESYEKTIALEWDINDPSKPIIVTVVSEEIKVIDQ